MTMQNPLISVIIANYNSAEFINECIQSILNQTYQAFEIIFVDDGSDDNSLDIATEIAKNDERLRIHRLEHLGSPSKVRNFGLKQAKGEWIAIIDADDHIHSQRFEKLIAFALHNNADIVIDDLLIFPNDGIGKFTNLLGREYSKGSREISNDEYVKTNYIYKSGIILGYAKPLIRAKTLRDNGIEYNETLLSGEDFHLIYSLLKAGAKFHLLTEILYFYRKHDKSFSHRLNVKSLEVLKQEFTKDIANPAVNGLIKSIDIAIDFENLVQAIKGRDWVIALRIITKNPMAMILLYKPIISRLRRFIKPKKSENDIVVITRQRITGANNGSSAYLISILKYLKQNGRKVKIIWPCKETFGRWPYLSLKEEISQFDELDWHGGLYLGKFVFSKDIKTYINLVVLLIDEIAFKLNITTKKFTKPLGGLFDVPYRNDDILYVAKHIYKAKTIISDYAVNTPYLKYNCTPNDNSFVIMHDFISQRNQDFADKNIDETFAKFDLNKELELLSIAKNIIAIQNDEASLVSQKLRGNNVIIAPMAVEVQTQNYIGDDNELLFVGSNAAPNIIGIKWFIEEIWPIITKSNPQIKLNIIGSVCRAINNVPENIILLGMVDDLSPFYKSASIVISPLTIGSGLKIKLIEAMSYGKAIVATTITAQGVEDIIKDFVTITDNETIFANAILELLQDNKKRDKIGQSALECAKTNFSQETCYKNICY